MTTVRLPVPGLVKGRGVSFQQPHRFMRDARDAFDDGWDTPDDGTAAPPATTVTWEDPQSAITHNDSPDIGFRQGLNPYRGCEHGCVYCFARPGHSYLGLSPGLDFETKLIAKRGIADVLRRELQRPAYRPELIALGTVTDAYQPIERDLRLTRGLLEVLAAAHHPVAIVTKGSGVERDIDLLAPMAALGLAEVHVTITTLDAKLARALEPRAAAPHRRLRTIRTLADAGIPVGVSVSPQIPFLNDDMEQVLQAAREAGAGRAFYQVLRLPWELSPIFRTWLQQHCPDRAERVMARVQEMRGGRDYDSDFAHRMKGNGIWADLIRQRFAKTTARLGLQRQRPVPDLSRFRPAALSGQGDLF